MARYTHFFTVVLGLLMLPIALLDASAKDDLSKQLNELKEQLEQTDRSVIVPMSEVILGKHEGKNGIADRLDKIEDLVGKRGNGWEDIVEKLNDSNDANNRNWEDNMKKQKKIIEGIDGIKDEIKSIGNQLEKKETEDENQSPRKEKNLAEGGKTGIVLTAVTMFFSAIAAIGVVLMLIGQASIKDRIDSKAQSRSSWISQNNREVTKRDLEEIGRKGMELGEKIKNLKTAMEKCLDSSGIVTGLAKCNEGVAELSQQIETLNRSCADIRNVDTVVQHIGAQLKLLIDQHPALVDFAITDAVGLLQACQEQGLTTVEQLRSCRQGYDAYAQVSKQAQDCEQALNALRNELESERKDNAELQRAQDMYCPAEFKAVQVALSRSMDGLSSAIQSAVTVELLHFYWYAAAFSNEPSRIKSAFVRLDDNLYELIGDSRQDLLQSVRQSIADFINDGVLRKFGTTYSIKWPELNDTASAHEEWYSRENNVGNRICKVRSALILNNSQVEACAMIYTQV